MNNGDLLIFDTSEGGEINNDANTPMLTLGFESAAYLSLFGAVGEKSENWMNEYAETESEKMQGLFSQVMLNRPLNSSTISEAEEAAFSDLEWFIDEGICSDIQVQISIVNPKRVNVRILLLQDQELLADFNFTENWIAMKNNRGTNGT